MFADCVLKYLSFFVSVKLGIGFILPEMADNLIAGIFSEELLVLEVLR